MPEVSVLLPVRDAASWLEHCLASLRRQTLSDHEVIVVNDGSTDGSRTILESWAAADCRLRVEHRSAQGLVASLNHGLGRCSAPLVARMDADDVSHPRRLELQRRLLLDRPAVGVCSSRVGCFPQHRVGEGFRRYQEWLNGLSDHARIARSRFVESPVAHPAVMIRRKVLEEHGGWRDVGWPEDHDLWLRLIEAGVKFGVVPRKLLFWRDHDDRLTRRDLRYAIDRFLACKAHFLARGPLRETSLILVWGAGPTGRRLVRALEAEGVRCSAFLDVDRRKVGREARGLPIVDATTLCGPQAGMVVLVAVAARGARDLVRTHLADLGLEEGANFWCCS